MKKILLSLLIMISGNLYSADLTEMIAPHVHLHTAIGYSSGEAEELASGHHAPSRTDGTIQGAEAGFSLRLGDLIEGFYTHNLHYGAAEEWEDEMEEAFLKLKLNEGKFELRGGRMQSRIGLINNKHLHSWDTIDLPLAYSSFISDDGLIINGGDITYTFSDSNPFILVAAYGDVMTHDCGDEEGHHHHDPLMLDDKTFTLSASSRLNPNDYNHYEVLLWNIIGDNSTNEESIIYGASFQYTWYENGFTEKGKQLRFSLEILRREGDFIHSEEHDHDEHSEHEHEEDHIDEQESNKYDASQTAFYASLVYIPNTYLSIGTRYEYVQKEEIIEANEREKIIFFSTFYFDDMHKYMTRIQYNHDNLKGENTKEDSVWLQLGISLGGPEVR